MMTVVLMGWGVEGETVMYVYVAVCVFISVSVCLSVCALVFQCVHSCVLTLIEFLSLLTQRWFHRL